ncbi:hypothetical protein IW261DRAFT_1424045 [Armillaria novae-zelandiae]|uniref:Uncharacterized protein n=1 Tax=Armillaria novae-zelandiae TaxID=153914 RepID=A0AA39U861_9AGAR|nr:hypothetical protein IW261DRAFT_1424045 [Armillaria novae-zelandiae]
MSIALKMESNTPDLQYWNLLKKILEQLGHHGMSPEESGTQMSNGMNDAKCSSSFANGECLRSLSISKLIDNMGKLPALSRSKGISAYRTSFGSDADYDGRVPPGVPRAMASVEELQISEEAFEFLNLAVQNL